MLENEFHIDQQSVVSLVSVISPRMNGHTTEKESEDSLYELGELVRTLGLEQGESYTQHLKKINAGTILGRGKLEEIATSAKEGGSSLLVFDFELTSGQIKNIKKITGLSVIDRCHIILEIFSLHARTKEAKLQIEIARMQYILPRLSGFWGHLGRQRGGIGVKGGEGEQQIELDRRIIRERVEHLKRQLTAVVISRKEQKKRRQKVAVTAALVGYTNSGKSSIMNRLCQVDMLEEDKLFATLDSSYRMLNPDTKPPMIMIDTVGFISNLPNTLIDGFKTTLESALEADLLVIICDISDPNYLKHLEVTHSVLQELGVGEKDQLVVFNKKDLLTDRFRGKIVQRQHAGSVLVSSFDSNDMQQLKADIIDYFLNKQTHYELFIPYSDGAAHSVVTSKTNILKRTPMEKGIFYRVRVPDFILEKSVLTNYLTLT
ncbi:MAG: GTPase HflX [Bdellovibrionales bacterium]|jgi:GTPase|nr:GTPase HflX [Bdellovibrionales bacterium]MBT3526922.1 GTPase HflX [Bdellovibrionales bacterium]MBT7669630.1 GTPase HflX [Bdellovibrionales bacterium]MBT7767015.1 GTPase HflX [Bdellovibrionales bacterium]